MKISIVTISFNQAEFLERTIQSVLLQEGVDIEYIIVDPGSTDGSRDIIERYRDRISHIIYEKDNGPADGLNRGFARATGDVFSYLNSDDEFIPGAFQKAAAEFAAHPEMDVIYANGQFVDGSGKLIRGAVSSKYMNPVLYSLGAAVVIQQATFIKASAFRNAGGFNILNKTCWDGELLLDIAIKGGKFRRVWDVWGLFRIHGGSITGSGRLHQAYLADQRRLFEKARGRPVGRFDAVVGKCVRAATLLCDAPRLIARIRQQT